MLCTYTVCGLPTATSHWSPPLPCPYACGGSVVGGAHAMPRSARPQPPFASLPMGTIITHGPMTHSQHVTRLEWKGTELRQFTEGGGLTVWQYATIKRHAEIPDEPCQCMVGGWGLGRGGSAIPQTHIKGECMANQKPACSAVLLLLGGKG